MKSCTRCSTVNLDGAVCCKACGERTFYLNRPRAGQTKTGNRGIYNPRFASLAWVWICICIAAVGGEVIWRQARLNQLKSELAAERSKLPAERAVTVADQDRLEQARIDKEEASRLSDLQNLAVLSGAAARDRHEKEWSMRVAHDPRLARTILETNLLTMEELGQDTTLAAQTVLERVALLASPQGSRVEVTPEGDEFRVRVAFMMSRMSSHEAGAVTKYTTTAAMREEIQELSAHVLRDLYSYCGSRGIRSISVTCNHTLLQTLALPGATDEERMLLLQRARPMPARLYRVSLDETRAAAIADWRRASLSRVAELSTVEYDGLVTLTISSNPLANQDAHDAEGELQF
jgi:hypothetical protein